MAHHVGLHTAAFRPHCFPTIRQDPPANKARHFSFSEKLLYGGASLELVTFSPGGIPKSLPPNRSIISWAIEVPYFSLLSDQHNLLTPQSNKRCVEEVSLYTSSLTLVIVVPGGALSITPEAAETPSYTDSNRSSALTDPKLQTTAGL